MKQVKREGFYSIFRDMLEETHPRHRPLTQPSPHEALIHLGKIEGYDQLLNILDMASELTPPERPQLDPTFEPLDSKE